ncbi:MAG TPA: beta-propeller fold lactonase family protein [Candidatus Angelobacter sp.]|nr:beta-propeller fold lactonase family protein [Candidatus Angelobacter sp.]
MKASIFAALAVMLGGLTSCISTGKQFFYVTGPGTNEVFQFQILSNGTLTPLNPGNFGVGSNPVSVVFQPAGDFAFVANFLGNNVTALAVNHGNGQLSVPQTTSPLPPPTPTNIFSTGTGPISMAVTPASTFLFVLNQGSNNVSGFAIDPTTGNLNPVSGSPFATGCSGSSVTITPKADALFVTCPGARTVVALAVSSQGVLAAPTVVNGPSGAPTFASVDPTGRFLYVADPSLNAVLAFTIGSSGALTPISGSPFASGTQPVALASAPEGNLLFVANKGSNNVSAFVIAKGSGALGAVSGSPFATGGTGPSFVAASGAFVYVGDQGTNDVAAFAIGSNGALTAVPNSPFNVATSPAWITLLKE